jgi:nickel-dependent lactate racemase
LNTEFGIWNFEFGIYHAFMNVELAYGRTGLAVNFPGDRTTVIEPTYIAGLGDEKKALEEALQNPLGKPPLGSLVKSGQTVAISVCDITRPMPSRRVLPPLLKELAHVPAEQIVILIATGTHRPETRDELEQILGKEVVANFEVINHSAFDPDLVQIGVTSNGIPIWLNPRWVESDVRITTGFVEPHFFAGFSGGPKMVAPGLAGFKTIIELHSAHILSHPDATWGKIESNPVHATIREIARKTGVDFSLDVTINRDHQITGVYAGELFKAHEVARGFAKKTAMRPVPEAFDIVVTTNSGYPLDLNLYQSVKGMSAAARIVRPGGTIICAAECWDGIPDAGEYKEILESGSSPEELLEIIKSPGYSRHDQWQVQLQAQIQLKARVFLKSSYLSPEQVRAAHLEPIEDIEATVEQCLTEYGPGSRACVLPQGPQTIPYLV